MGGHRTERQKQPPSLTVGSWLSKLEAVVLLILIQSLNRGIPKTCDVPSTIPVSEGNYSEQKDKAQA